MSLFRSGSARARPISHIAGPVRATLACAVIAGLGLPGAAAAAPAQTKAKLNRIAARIDRAEEHLAVLEVRLRVARAAAERADREMRSAQTGLNALARGFYMAQADGRPDVLRPGEVQAYVDRLVYTDVAQRLNRDIVETVRVRAARLEAAERSVTRLRAAEARELRALKRENARLQAIFRAELARLARMTAVARASRGAVRGPSPFEVCPVDHPRAYSNDFGAPRYGGGFHSHQGNDILAPRGTPIRAPFDGIVRAGRNPLGGLTVRVTGSRGHVYNAHLSAYGQTRGFVTAGTIVGYVGDSGNARGGPMHNHFEWHPGGGEAVNPYYFLNAVC